MAGPDLSVFDRIKTKVDFDREEEMFQLKRAAVQQAKAGNLPAAIQIANEIEKRRSAGNEDSAKLLESTAKIHDKGVQYDPQTGQYIDMSGYAGALGNLKFGEQSGAEQAKNVYEPARAGAVEQQKLQQQLGYAPQIEGAKKQAGIYAEKETELSGRVAALPQLQQTAEQLSALGKKATYTAVGRAGDYLRTQSQAIPFDVPVIDLSKPSEGAIARSEYISLVDNQILPLLRETFGAQFTEKEGGSLKVTLGDPNLPPEQKDAVLRSFIEQKMATINSLQRQLGNQETDFGANPNQGQGLQPMSKLETEESIFNAKKAIRNGASPVAVRQRLMESGIDPAKAGL